MKANYIVVTMLGLGLCACAPPTPELDVTQAVPAPAPVPAVDDVDANSTAVAANATAASAYSHALEARERARSIEARNTALARATDRSFESEATRISLAATSTALALQATVDLGVATARQTADVAALQASMAEQAAHAQSTSVALAVTQSAVFAQQSRERAEAEWETDVVTPARTVGMVLLTAALAIGLGYCGLRLFDAAILRARIIRDPAGQVVILPEPDRGGRQTVILPSRSPGAVLQITPPTLQSSRITAEAIDSDTTQRAQVIEGLRVTAMTPSATQRQSPPLLTAGQHIRVIEQLPAPAVADVHAIQALDADWRQSHD